MANKKRSGKNSGTRSRSGSRSGSRSRSSGKHNDKYVSQIVRDEIIGVVLIGMACLGFVLMFTEGGGALGTEVMKYLRLISGDAIVLVLVGVAFCGFLIMSKTAMPLRSRIVGIVTCWFVMAAFLHLGLGLGVDAAMDAAKEGRGGGLIGGGLMWLLVSGIGRNGSYVVLSVLGVVGLLLIFNRSLIQLFGRAGSGVARGVSKIGNQLSDFGSEVFGDSQPLQEGAETGRFSDDRIGGKSRNKGAGVGSSEGATRRGAASGKAVGKSSNRDSGKDSSRVKDTATESAASKSKPWPYQYFAGEYGPEFDEADEVVVVNFDGYGASNSEDKDDKTAVFGQDGADLAAETILQAGVAGRASDGGKGLAGAEKDQGLSSPDHGDDPSRSGDSSGGRDSSHLKDTRQLVQSTPISRQSVRGKVYKLPGLNLLHKPVRENKAGINKVLTENVKLLEETLANFGVTVKVVRVTQGPAITRFELQPAPGIKVSRITSLSDDIALALAASNVRIEAPIPGKSVVGIEVPNPEISPVHFREVIESSEYRNMPSKMTVALGKDISGNTIVGDLSKMPHLLIAGATGSGKSVCINSIICSVLFKACPDEVKMLLIDPKMVELINYNGAPHLVAPVVVDPQKAAGALKWMVTEMDSRYELFARAGVRDIVRYNFLALEQEERDKLAGKEGQDETVFVQAAVKLGADYELDEAEEARAEDEVDQDEGKEFSAGVLPYVVIIIDELADLMMVAPADVEDSICRLAQMARAAGIHLIVATQRPSVDVITGLIKANIPSRIAFAVSSQVDSRTILDMAGAEKLLGRGDMLYSNMSIAKPIRVQGCFLDDGEVKNIVDFWKEQAIPKYLEIPEGSFKVAQNEEPEDEFFYKAVQIIIDSNTASVSYLQRRLKIGYTRAARLMDSLEEKGVVGRSEGAKPREILMTRGVFEQRFGKWHDN
ncbi:MAG: FtsK/SpoIIIE domain-containing protein [Peptococcaceae bacterium]|nr:FtsK/SpoIIIE domain-containing protein [Peptococcaceae bacterium]